MISTHDSEAASWEDPPHIPSVSVNTNNEEDTTKTDTDDDDDTYIQATATTCPPLVKLQFYGMCCPFIETEEEYDARIGYSNLQNYPIKWYCKKVLSDFDNDDAKGIAPSLIDGIGQLFKSGGATSTISNDNSSSKRITMSYIGVMATLTIVDTDNHGPVLQIRSLDGWNDPTNEDAQNAVKEYITNGKPWWEDECVRDKPPSKVIPLYMIDKVASGFSLIGDSTAGGVKLYGTPTSKGFLSGSAAPELLRFDTLGGSGGNSWSDDVPWSSGKPSNEPNKYSDRIIVQLKSLVDWNRRRMTNDIKHGRVSVAPKSSSPGYIVS